MSWALRILLAVGCLLSTIALAPRASAQPRPTNDQIDKAVEKGVKFLRGRVWDYSTDEKKSSDWQYDAGATALIGLALLESDVSVKDPTIVAAARAIRSATPKMTKTYPISLTIMFLDRYGGASESETIRDLAYRLVAGQDASSWGWKYECPIVKDHRGILSYLQQNRGRTDFGKYEPSGTACNSNTQFAVLALWIARRHNVPADFVLARAEARFRNTQHADGGWGYRHDTEGSSPSMTCSGLLGLAVGFGNRKAQLQSGGRVEDSLPAKPAKQHPEDIRTDPKVEQAKAWLSKQLQRKPQDIGHWPYFLWSLERVGVVYGFDELGKVNWYNWGAAALIASQKEDGSWEGGYPPQVNTAFCLLFLRKANLARDLSGIAQLRPQAGDKLVGNAAPNAAKADGSGDAARLVKEFPAANAGRQKEILKTLEETKDPTGAVTQALLDLIAQLQGEQKEKTRSALAARLSRQSANALRERLGDADPELRLAAARAAGIKQAQELVPDLVQLLEAKDPTLVAAAKESLKAITKRDGGK
jgi:hypothetical protein